MDWIDRMNEAIRYIEENLTDRIEYEKLGQIACCSAYHFQRMFAYIAGVPLSEYIRRRRMSLAAVDLQGGDAKIIDVAAKYGYSSPTAFNRAFQSVHGVSPSSVRAEGAALKSFPPLTIKIVVKGAEEMNYRIETRDAFRVVGRSRPMSREIEQNFVEVPMMWQEAVEDGTLERIIPLMDGQPRGILGVCACGGGEEWRYYKAAATSAGTGDGREEYGVPVLETDICGSGFLYNMVRIIEGALLACGCGKISAEAISRALECGDRELLGKTMPAKGLILLRAEYEADPFGKAAE